MKGKMILIGALAGTALFLGLRGMVKGAVKDSALSKTDTAGTPAEMAQRFTQAFFESGAFGSGLGTDEKLVFDTLAAIPNREFWEKVKQRYRQLREGDSLMGDLQSELRVEEMEVAKAILDSLPARSGSPPKADSLLTAYARRLHWALKLYDPYAWGGIEWQTIKTVAESIPASSILPALNERYRSLHGESLWAHLLEELSDEEFSELKSIFMNKTDAKGKTFAQIARGE